MRISAQLILAGLGAATLLAGASGAQAGRWQNNHPWRVQVNHRLANQNRRIDREYRAGDITRAQAQDLHAEDRGIRGQERFDASQNGSHLTAAEHQQLNQEENGVSSQIGNPH